MKKTVLKDVRFLNLPTDGHAPVQEEPLPATGDAARDAAATIGRNVERLRRAAGVEAATLAERSDLPVERLEAVERGDGFPGLRVLWRIAAALSVPFGALLDGTILSEASDGDFRVQRAGDGKVFGSVGGLRSRVLSPEGVAHAPEVYELTLRPGSAETADGHGPATCEHIVVTAGRLVVQADAREATLDAGDALFFRADVPHRYLNPGGVDARALLVMVYA